jgi:hypothetical protein
MPEDVYEDFGNYEPTKGSEGYYRSIGAPSWFGSFEAKQRALERRGPGSISRRLHPSWQDLTQDETGVLRVLNTRYDRRGSNNRHGNVTMNDFPGQIASVDALERLGFLRVEDNGRIVPSWVFEEHRSGGGGYGSGYTNDANRRLDE